MEALAKESSDTGRARSRVHALVIEPGELELVKAIDAEPGKSKQVTEQDPLKRLADSRQVIEPPFNLFVLATLPERNTELGPCIEAMETNIDGFGHRLISRVNIDHPDTTDALKEAVKEERIRLENFFLYAGMDDSFRQLRRNTRSDKESTGNGYWEVIRDARGDIQYFKHMRSYQVRLTSEESNAALVEMPFLKINRDGSYEVENRNVYKKFRRYVQSRTITRTGYATVGYHTQWFKEFGDPRNYSSDTGELIPDEKLAEFPPDKRANEVIHFKLYSPRSPYGLPRFIGALLDIEGDRKASEINYVTFSNNNVPSIMITVSNGVLTESTIERLKEFFQGLQGDDNRAKAIIVEAEPIGESEEGESPEGQVKIGVERLREEQHTDAMFTKYTEANQLKVRVAFRLPPLFVGRCHGQDTEYLTFTGWKLFRDIADSDLLGTLNTETGELEFQAATERHEYDYDGQMLLLQNNGINALVTPNHRFWTRPAHAAKLRPADWNFVEAQYLDDIRGKLGGCIELPVSCSWSGEERQTFLLPHNRRANAWNPSKPSKNPARDLAAYKRLESENSEREVPMDSFLRFLGYFVAEGSTTKTRGPITLSRNRGAVADDMIASLKELNFDPTIVNSRRDELNIGICHVGFWEWLREHCGTCASDKRFPRWILGLSCRQQLIFLNALVAGDGHRPPHGSEGSFAYSTTSKKLIDLLHELCIRLGYAMTSRVKDRSDEGWQDLYSSYSHFDSRHLLRTGKQVTSVDYEGKVSCFSVPNGTLVTRRNGRVLISGNSQEYNRAVAETSRRVADEQIFGPERDEFDSFINRILFPAMGVVYHQFKSNSPNTTDNTELVRILSGSEKTGGMTPRIARVVLEDILGIELGDIPADKLDPDIPFSLTMAEAVKNLADQSEPGQTVTALKTVKGLLGEGAAGEDVVEALMVLRKQLEEEWSAEVGSEDEDEHDHDSEG